MRRYGERGIYTDRKNRQTERNKDRQTEKVHQGKLATPQLSLAFLPAAETKSIIIMRAIRSVYLTPNRTQLEHHAPYYNLGYTP